MPRPVARRLTAALLATGLLLAGCSSDDEPSAGGSTTTTRGRPLASVTNPAGMSVPSSSSNRSSAGLSSTATTSPHDRPSGVVTVAPTSSCTQSASGSSMAWARIT